MRKLRDQNISFLLKLGFDIASDKETLWVQPLLRENLIWLVGNGSKIRCWKDNWVPRIGPLIKFIPANVNIDSDCLLNEMVTEEGLWNLDLFRTSEKWIFLNTNGAVQLGSENAAGIVHDKTRDWVSGILEGLKLIQCGGHDKVIIQSDRLEVVKALQGSISNISNSSLVANCLAKLALDNKEDLQVFDSPPKEILALIDSDKSK
ncbi:hypothetical protein Golax_010827, partial [Gossypium laxum]|nr:hypothetical protein [Gossypium laxum]